MIQLGLCCIFRREPIRFRRKTAASLKGFSRAEQLACLASLCLQNARSLRQALHYYAGGAYGDKKQALARLARRLERLRPLRPSYSLKTCKRSDPRYG